MFICIKLAYTTLEHPKYVVFLTETNAMGNNAFAY